MDLESRFFTSLLALLRSRKGALWLELVWLTGWCAGVVTNLKTASSVFVFIVSAPPGGMLEESGSTRPVLPNVCDASVDDVPVRLRSSLFVKKTLEQSVFVRVG